MLHAAVLMRNLMAPILYIELITTERFRLRILLAYARAL